MENRRNFIKSAILGTGGLLAADALAVTEKTPSCAADCWDVFEKRGSHERLTLAYQHVKIGLEKPFSVLHISDTHLCAADERESEFKRAFAERRNQVFGGRMEAALRDSLAWAKANVDVVLHTGDLIDFQTQANYDLVRKYLCEAPNLFGCAGNHEYQGRNEGEIITNDFKYNDLTAEEVRKAIPYAKRIDSVIVGGVNFVSLEQTYGVVCEEQVEGFGKEVQKGLPIVLCMHAPFMTDAIWRASCRFWAGYGKKYRSAHLEAAKGDYRRQLEDPLTTSFIARLKKEPLLKAICAGHLHITISDEFSPTAKEYVVGGNFLFHGQEILFT